METYKQFTYTLNISSPCTYIANKQHNVMRDIQNTFVNKCYGGYFIIKIDDILNMSQCRTINSNQDAICIINVCFRALVKYYSPGDIIANVRICISEGQICGIGENVIVTFSSSPNNKILTNGQTIPVMIGNKVHYNIGSKNVNVLGSILLPETSTTTYKIVGTLDLTSSKVQGTFGDIIKLIESQDSSLNESSTKKFISLMNSSGNIIKKDGIDLVQFIKDNRNTSSDVTGYWQKNLKTSSSDCYYIKDQTGPNEGAIEITVNEAFLNMLNHCYSKRKGIIDLAKIYKDSQMYDQANNIWTLMERNKL